MKKNLFISAIVLVAIVTNSCLQNSTDVIEPTELHIVGGDRTIMIWDKPLQLQSQFYPTPLMTPAVVWSSDNLEVGRVDENGVLTPIGAGRCRITAKLEGKDLSHSITVTVDATGAIVLENGLSSVRKPLLPDQNTYTIQVSPTEGVEIGWISTNSAVATIDSTGTATLLSKGSTTITATSRSEPRNFDSIELIVSEIEISIIATGVERNGDRVTVVVEEVEFIQLKAQISGGTSDKFTWSTTNPEVVEVDRNGLVSVIGVGFGHIGVKSDENPQAKDSIIIEVVRASDNIVEIQGDDPLRLILDESTSHVLTAVVKDNERESVEWSSSRDSVATIDSNGKLSLHGTGASFITATSTSNPQWSDSINLEVFGPVSEVKILELDPIQVPLGVEQTLVFHAVVEGGITGEVEWSAAPSTAIEHRGDGNFLFKGTESATVTATSKEAPDVSSTVNLEPVAPVSDVEISGQAVVTLYLGEDSELALDVEVTGGINKSVEWESGDTDIATVSSDGVVKILGTGVVTITATSIESEDHDDSVQLVIEKREIEIQGDDTVLLWSDFAGVHVFTATVTGFPSAPITWTSTNPRVASINSSGEITIAGLGNTSIVATSTIVPGLSDSVSLKIYESVSNVDIAGGALSIVHGSVDTHLFHAAITGGKTKKVLWTSLNTSVAIIDEVGLARILGPGATTITATSDENPQIADSVVLTVTDVTVMIQGQSRVEIESGSQNSYQFNATVSGGKTNAVEWISTNTEVAEIEPSGVASITGTGETTITAISKENFRKRDSITLVVYTSVSKVEIAGDSIVTLVRGTHSSYQFFASVAGGTTGGIEWDSNKPWIASINQEGVVSIHAAGTATIEALSRDNTSVRGTLELTVQEATLSIPGAARIELLLEQSGQHTFSAHLNGVETDEVVWHSSRTSVATVDEAGAVTLVGAGTTRIHAQHRQMADIRTQPVELVVSDRIVEIAGEETINLLYDEDNNTLQFSASVRGEGHTGVLTWSSSDTSVATIDANRGLATIRGSGTTTIAATSTTNPALKDEVTVIVSEIGIEIEGAPERTLFLKQGEHHQLAYSLSGTDESDIAWNSSNTQVAVVDDGRVTALRPGTTTITVISLSNPGIVDSVTITVADVTVQLLGEQELSLVHRVDTTHQLHATAFGGITNGIEWNSSDTDVVRVDSGGLVSVEGVGEATITVSSTEQTGKSDSVTVVVSKISLEIVKSGPTTLIIGAEEFHAFQTRISGGKTNEITWSSSKPEVVEVDSFGVAFAVGVGTAKIKATSVEDSTIYDEVAVTVTKLGVEIQGEDTIRLISGVDTSHQFQVETSGGTTNEVAWSSSNTTVATVDSSGLLSILEAGTTTITARSTEDPAKFDTVVVTVQKIAIHTSGWEFPVNLILDLDDNYQLEASVSGGITNKINWSTSDPRIATVDHRGIVSLVAAGIVSITATSQEDSRVKRSLSLEVFPRITSIDITGADSKEIDLYKQSMVELEASVVGGISGLVSWSSSDPEIASVAQNGIVMFKKGGVVSIRATSDEAPLISGEIEFQVFQVTGISIDGPPVVRALGGAGKTHTFTGVVTGGSSGGIVWSSSLPEVARFNGTGTASLVGAGITLVTATSEEDPNWSTSILLRVYVVQPFDILGPDPRRISLPKQGSSPIAYTLVTDISGGISNEVIWASSDPAVASFDGVAGALTPKNAGTTEITATSRENPRLSSSITVYVAEYNFTTVWDTNQIYSPKRPPAPSTRITLPLRPQGSYDFIVDWGDGTSDRVTEYDDPDRSHVYPLSGEYEVNISGLIRGWGFPLPSGTYRNDQPRFKLVEVKQWGPLQLIASDSEPFQHCTNLKITATDELDVSEITDFALMFGDCHNLEYINGIEDWDVSHITDMDSMFVNSAKFNADLSGWDFSNVESVKSMFSWTALSPENYDKLLISWANQDMKHGMTSRATNIKYSSDEAASARQRLIDSFGWKIHDAGRVTS